MDKPLASEPSPPPASTAPASLPSPVRRIDLDRHVALVAEQEPSYGPSSRVASLPAPVQHKAFRHVCACGYVSGQCWEQWAHEAGCAVAVRTERAA